MLEIPALKLESNRFFIIKKQYIEVNESSKLIDNHFNENITSASAADMCYLSYSHFAKLFKDVMHTTFIQYLNYFRVHKAESLLLDFETSITDIALGTGFNDASYFIKQFKYYKGVSPKQYDCLLIKSKKMIHPKIKNQFYYMKAFKYGNNF